MSAVVLHPFPRLPDKAVRWGPWGSVVDGKTLELKKISESWDANSRIRLYTDVSVDSSVLEAMGLSSGAELLLSATSRATATTVSARVLLRPSGGRHRATVNVELDGESIAEQLDLTAAVIAPVTGTAWLKNRVIAERRVEKVSLDQEQQGFPISAVSFEAEGWSAAPWKFEVYATHPADTFSQSVRLFINEDYEQSLELLEDKGNAWANAMLHAAIARQLVATMVAISPEAVQGPDELADENPESFAAAARMVAAKYFKQTLKETCRIYRERPELFEQLLLHETGFMKGA